MISKRLGFKPVYENFQDNPYLKKFYENPIKYAFRVEQYFLNERFNQIKSVVQKSTTKSDYVADYGFFRSLVFASATLAPSEFDKFKKEYNDLAAQLITPDIVIYLRCPVRLLLRNIKKRGREFENTITIDYLRLIEEKYRQYMHEQHKFPVIQLDINTTSIMEDPVFFEKIVEILKQKSTFYGYNTIKL